VDTFLIHLATNYLNKRNSHISSSLFRQGRFETLMTFLVEEFTFLSEADAGTLFLWLGSNVVTWLILPVVICLSRFHFGSRENGQRRLFRICYADTDRAVLRGCKGRSRCHQQCGDRRSDVCCFCQTQTQDGDGFAHILLWQR